jgi:hypothetical protein
LKWVWSSVGLVLPDAVDRSQVGGVSAQGSHVRHGDVQECRPHAVSDRLGLFHNRFVVLSVRPVDGVFTRARVIVPSTLVGQELGQLPIALVSGGPV